ncbi:MAG: tRNA 2-thiouridine(34) synthase MnmA [Pseudomonadales bacterium]|jgi:tRNA-specific 2-thiouridylase|nr:tRNA 2-thiouridine(34) synthase MnmA [Pseudomonadales bacterium]
MSSSELTPHERPEGTVIVGMSGGVDSSVAALRLLEAGRSVEGLFMKNWDEDDGTEYCTALADLEDARRVADRLGIRLHTANFAAEYWDNVFEAFLAEYRAHRTPNPDVLCNREIKFQVFVEYAELLGAERIATGHYARLRRRDGRVELLRARDEAKDQTYFLHAVPGAQLARCEFPLGAMTKQEVRDVARRAGFHNHGKKDSTGICFIGERRFADFLARYVASEAGIIESVEGEVVGEHRGLSFYTLGQRQGLGIGGRAHGSAEPWYVAGKDVDRNVLLVAQGHDHPALASDWLVVRTLHWIDRVPELPLRCTAKVRYRQTDQEAEVSRRADGTLRVQFDAPQRAVTPGQWVCLYDGEVCLGGGVIETHGRTPGVAGLAA